MRQAPSAAVPPRAASIGGRSEVDVDVRRKRMERFAQPPSVVTCRNGVGSITMSPVKEQARSKMRAERFALASASPGAESEVSKDEMMRLKRIERFASG